MDEMRCYRAYFLSPSDHIRSVTAIQSVDDASACLEAERLLSQSTYSAIEVWEGRRLIWHSERDARAARESDADGATMLQFPLSA